jgi:hypothetical protein
VKLDPAKLVEEAKRPGLRVRSWRSYGDPEGKSPRLLDRGTAMNREPDAGGPGHLTPETLAGLEELLRLRLGGFHEFRLSIRDAGLVLRGRAKSHHAKQMAQQALMDVTR